MTTVQVKYSTASDLTGATTTAAVTADTSADLTGAVDLTSLAAGTKYYYDVLVDGAGQLTAPYPSFSTFPASGSPTQFSFAFGSCTKHADTISADTIFDALPTDIAFLMHLGDVIYADRDSPTTSVLSGYRQKHRNVLAGSDSTSASFEALRKRTPVFTMLDDHDILNNADGGTSRSTVSQAKQAFLEYPARANPDSLTTGELYYAFQVGDVGFFVTDSRTMRSANSATDDASKTILGATQKAALKNWLLTNKTALKLKFICATTPMHGYAANTGNDSWGGIDDGTQAPNGSNGFRTERNEIWDYIDTNQIPGVIVISGDQHWAGSFKTTYAGRPRYEFMATPFNMTNTSLFMLNAVARAADPVNGPVLWKLDQTMNAGVVSVDTTVSPATVSFQLYGTGGSLGASYLTSITSDDIDANLIPAPAVTLSATFPTTTHVGDTINFDVTATLADGATGTLTITADTLPAGLTLGGTSQVDATHYKATVSGTLTTVQDVTATFGATGGSVAATPLVHEFNVSASTGPATFVQGAYLAPTDPNPLVLPNPPMAGNRLILSGYLGDTRTFSAPDASWELVTSFHDVADARLITIYTKISDGTEQTIHATFSGGTLHGASAVEFSDAGSIEATFFTGVAPTNGSTTRRDFGPTNAPANANAIPLIISGWEFGGNTYTFDSGWAGLAFASNGDRLIPHYAYRSGPPNAAVSMSLSYSSGTNNSSPTPYVCLWIDPK